MVYHFFFKFKQVLVVFRVILGLFVGLAGKVFDYGQVFPVSNQIKMGNAPFQAAQKVNFTKPGVCW